MAYEPEFMRRFAEFDAERRRLATIEDWRAFAARWFDTREWPTKTAEQRAAESRAKQGPLALGGRRWSFTSWTYDLTPEARYEYFATLRGIGDPIRFPWLAPGPSTGVHLRHECPFCEISTDDHGEAVCPRCGRALIQQRYE